MDLVSKYATITGCQDKLDSFNIPKEWWSRRFEYPWASQFVKPTDFVVDAACGVPHFFKHWLAQHCRHVVAIDRDPALKTVRAENNLTCVVGTMTAIPVADKSADVVFCISVLEHVNKLTQMLTLREFSRIVKDDGLIVVTVDVPDIKVSDYIEMVTNSTLTFAGEIQTQRPEDILVGYMPQSTPDPLNVFCSVLRPVKR